MDAALPLLWRITSVSRAGSSLYDVELELGENGDVATATLAVGNRASRSAAHEPADWAIAVELCDDERARAWLEAPGHEYAIGDTCVWWETLRASRRRA